MPLPENPPTGRLPFEPPPQSASDLEEFWDLWRQEKFWACHEALEESWKAESNPERKQFLQGLLHGAVSVFQFRRGNFIGATRQFTRAKVRLGASLPERDGVNVTAYLEGIKGEIEASFDQLNTKAKIDLLALEQRLKAKCR